MKKFLCSTCLFVLMLHATHLASQEHVDVLFVLPDDVVSELGSEAAAITRAGQYVSYANVRYDDTGKNVALRMIGTIAVDADFTNKSTLSQLNDYSSLQIVQDKRRAYGADIISILTTDSSDSARGWADVPIKEDYDSASDQQQYLYDKTYNITIIDTNSFKDFDARVYTHETAHNFGCGHINLEGWDWFSYAATIFGEDSCPETGHYQNVWHGPTIMDAYDEGSPHPTVSCFWPVDSFSDPNRTYYLNDQQYGLIYDDEPLGESGRDHARTIGETKSLIAGILDPFTFFDSQVDADEWRYYSWWGWFNLDGYTLSQSGQLLPWVWHQHHGWIYTTGDDVSEFFFWDDELGAWWGTSSSLYPVFWNYDLEEWCEYDVGTTDPRWFDCGAGWYPVPMNEAQTPPPS